ncbi:MAG: NAD(P)/FAD-dependent oxidoreductase [Bacteroidales bacterium]|jgi:uncharacterized FAD-dependent dehydrogenase|nr:NAD(P)/FAD-dependent oxidoreductase [Bacteroidales bacterium]
MTTECSIRLFPQEKDNSEVWRKKISAELGIATNEISDIRILRQSLDARSSKPFYQTLFKIYTKPDSAPTPTIQATTTIHPHPQKVIIIGAGPAGLFAALELVKNGYTPIILEQGKKVEQRKKDIVALQRYGILNENSNYCFGEGGAGTFSDGKLYTRSNKRGSIEKILQTLVYFGASPTILYDAHPHIGSDKLPAIITAIRSFLINAGAEFYFETKVVDFVVRGGQCTSVITAEGREFFCDNVILATGHSSNDIYKWFAARGYALEQKPFALGVRVEHPQHIISRLQYGHACNAEYSLPPAEYRFAEQVADRGVFSFCMCPGGVLVPSMTEQGTLVLNGMSASARSSQWANAGMVVTVSPSDYGSSDVLAGLLFREKLERKFFTAANINANFITKSDTASNTDIAANTGCFGSPAQRITDFISGRRSAGLPRSSYPLGIYEHEFNTLLPTFILQSLQQAFKQIDKKRKGFITEDAIVTGLESRTSSPVRILRNRDTFSHTEIVNLYPCGEGAGYAGGITSSAIDGINAVKSLIKKLC